MKSKLALTTIVGLIGGVVCVLLSIFEGGDIDLFINIPSLLIIVGGTIFALVMSYPLSTLKTLGSVIKQAFVENSHDLFEDINTIVELSEVSRRDGLLALESYAENSNDPFLKKGLNLLVDGNTREYLEDSMVSEIYHAQKRHRTGTSMVSMIATLAPSLGLVGTYVGLIPMLVHMTDPDSLGPMMAIELVSSFYGGFLANVIFSPMAKKLSAKSAQEKDRSDLILEGILAIHDGKSPRLIREDLMTYLTKQEAAKLPRSKQKAPAEEHTGGKVIDYKNKAKQSKAEQKGA
ncbi:MAG: motility protein A [Candidatus Pelethousia sp.]|nr:motility protein A [Candidatus Pelethousia sp.]